MPRLNSGKGSHTESDVPTELRKEVSPLNTDHVQEDHTA